MHRVAPLDLPWPCDNAAVATGRRLFTLDAVNPPPAVSGLERAPETLPLTRIMAAQVAAMTALFEQQLRLVGSGAHPAEPAAVHPIEQSAVKSAVHPIEQSAEHASAAPTVPQPAPTVLRATQAQLELLALIESDASASQAYSEMVALELRGEFDLSALQAAWRDLAKRHEALRLRVVHPVVYLSDGPSSVRSPSDAPSPEWRFVLGDPPPDVVLLESDGEQADDRVAQAMARPIDLRSGPLARLEVHRLGPDRHLLLLCAHHLMADGWSLGLLLAECTTLYSAHRLGVAPQLPPAQPWYRFVEWSADLAQQAAAPSTGLGGVDPVAESGFLQPPPPLVLPGAQPLRGFQGRRLHRRNQATRELMVLVRDCGRRLAVSPVVVLLTAYAVFLARLSGQRRLGVGLPLAGHTLAEMPLMVGMASAVMPLDIRLQDVGTFTEAVGAVQDALAKARRGSRGLFSGDPRAGFPVTALFNIDPGVRLNMAGLTIDPLGLPLQAVKTGLFFNLLELNGQVLLDFDCHAALADESTAARWLEGLTHLIQAACREPEAELGALDLGPLTAQARDTALRLRDGFNGNAAIGLPAGLLRCQDDGQWVETRQLARCDAEGLVEILGPLDRHVRLSAGWADLDALEAALRSQAGVRDAAVIVESDGLTAFVQAAEPGALEVGALNRAVAQGVPSLHGPQGIRPSAYVLLEEPLERDSTGALAEAALRALPLPRIAPEERVAPRTALESRLAALWQEVLSLAQAPGVTEDFFALGGHSLKAVALANRVAQQEGRTLRLADFFRSPTVAGMARLLEAARPVEPIARLKPHARRLASDAQRRMWLLEQLSGDQSAYNMGFLLEWRGGHRGGHPLESRGGHPEPLSADRVRQALQALMNRHEALADAIVERGGELELVGGSGQPPELIVHDLRGQVASRQIGQELALACVTTRFDLGQAPLWRCALLHRDEGDALVVAMHHAVGDNWSIIVWVRDFLAALSASGLPSLPIQYADYAAWHNRRIDSIQTSLDYWKSELSGLPEKLLLPCSRPRAAAAGGDGPQPSGADDPTGHTLSRRLRPAVHAAFRDLGRSLGLSGFVILTAAWRLWLWGQTGARDAVLGTVHAGRDHPQVADLIGLFVNTLPLRLKLQPESSFRDLLESVRRTAVAAFEHADVPFNRIVEAAQLESAEPGHPLFDMVVTHDDFQDLDQDLRRQGWSVSEVDIPASPFELILTGSEDADGMEIRLQYRTALWDAPQIETWLMEMEALLERVCAQPHRPLQALVLPNDVKVPSARTSVLAHFEAWRRRRPDAPAVLGSPVRSYGELGGAADDLGLRLRAAACGAEQVVAVLIERNWDLPVAVLGVMKGGGAFVLLDPAHPLERLAFIVRDAGCRWLVHSAGHAALAQRVAAKLESTAATAPELIPVHADPAPGAAPSLLEEADPQPGDLAYLIYTSGSTGEPKGVLVDHAALSAHLEGITPLTRWSASDRSLLFATVAVDAVIEQLLLPLVNGAAFCILDPERYSPQAYVQAWCRWDATILDVPPVFWGELIQWCRQRPDDIRGRVVKTLMTGGEEMTPHRVAGWYGLPLYCGRILNLFGPTETTCSPVIAQVGPSLAGRSRIPIGFPVGARQIRLVRPDGEPSAADEDGELLLGGASVARGYLHRPELTAQRFITDAQGQRWYRTGDRVRRRVDGELEFLGRIDRQFKLRGFRIEPGEIEDALRRCEGVQDAAVTIEAGEQGDELQAWLVLHPGAQVTRAGIIEPLSAALPVHMVPARLRCIGHLPLSRTEKLDRQALREMPGEDLWDPAEAIDAPEDPSILGRLCSLIAAVVGIPTVRPVDNFFAIGGHSLKAIQVVARVRDHLGVEIRLKDVFTAATVADLARIVETLSQANAPRIRPVSRSGRLIASAGQKRLWLLQAQQPDLVAFNMVAAFHIEGPLALGALQWACRAIVQRHEVLRTRLCLNAGEVVQDILAGDGGVSVAVESVDDLEAALEQARQSELRRPFRLDLEVPIRWRILQSGGPEPACHGLVVNVHHAAFDGWSATVLLKDLAVLYRQACEGDRAAEPPNAQGLALTPLQIQYADYAHWQQALIPPEQRRWWLSRFEGQALPELQLPLDHPRPDQPSTGGALVERGFGARTSRSLRELAVHEGVTLFGVMLALTACQLHALSGQTDFVVGTAVAGRDAPELENQIGFYVNMLPLRCRIDPQESFRSLVRRCGRDAQEALLNQDYPFDQLVYELAAPRVPGRQPLFDVVLNLQNFEPMRLELDEARSTLLQDRSVSSKYDLMYMIDDLETLDLYLEYATDLFKAETAQQWAQDLVGLAEAAVLTPDIGVAELVAPWRLVGASDVSPEATRLEDDEW